MIRWLEKRRAVSILMLTLIATEIFYFSSLSSTGGAGGSAWIAFVYHINVFFLFNFFLFTTIKGDKKMNIKYLIIILLISTSYAVLDEVHQIFVPNRDASIRDVLIDTLGIFLSTFIYIFIDRKNNKKSGKHL